MYAYLWNWIFSFLTAMVIFSLFWHPGQCLKHSACTVILLFWYRTIKSYDILPSNTNNIYWNTTFHKRPLFVRTPGGTQTCVSARCMRRASQKHWLPSLARAPQGVTQNVVWKHWSLKNPNSRKIKVQKENKCVSIKC